jgi:3-deoxy-D-manno-octulosonic-acid transferase
MARISSAASKLARFVESLGGPLIKYAHRTGATAGGRKKFETAPHESRHRAPALPAMPGLALAAYRVLTRLACPVAPLLLQYRERRGKEVPGRLRERLGRTDVPRPTDGQLVWFHAASVGETNAILPVIEGMRAHRPNLRILLTTGTATSAKVAAKRLTPNDIHQFVPWDAPQYVENFIAHWQPDLLVLTESEIWPNLIMGSHAHHIPVALVNARMSERSRHRWRRNKRFAEPLFSRIALVLAQDDRLARDFAELGAIDARPVGNLKIDSPPLPVDGAAVAQLSEAIADRPVWIAASTHPGEDEAIIDAHKRIAVSHPDVLTIIAPRHPERGADIAALAEAARLRAVQRSTGAPPARDTAVYVADTIGELGLLYTVVPIAFIGGSLVDRGGQNPIEAVRFNAAVMTGPHFGNFTAAYTALLEHHGAICVNAPDALAEAVVSLLDDVGGADRMRSAAHAALETLSGALDRTVDALFELLPPPDADGTFIRAG